MDTETLRNGYRSSVIPPRYNGRLNAVMNIAVCVTLALAGAFLLVANMSVLAAASFVAGILVFNFFEYAFHRWISHRKRALFMKSYRRHTGEHHGFFSNGNMTSADIRDLHVTIMPTITIVVYFVLFSLMFSLPLYVLRGVGEAAGFSCAVAISLLQLDILHFYYHLDDRSLLSRTLNRFSYFRFLKHSHTVHHYREKMHSGGFNITHPLFDFLFGTLVRN
jgi:sterol desaturase/sphingolipid hydroxylase (fatty acid hydroxylase superfamily)